jgi:hypothetical protein
LAGHRTSVWLPTSLLVGHPLCCLLGCPPHHLSAAHHSTAGLPTSSPTESLTSSPDFAALFNTCLAAQSSPSFSLVMPALHVGGCHQIVSLDQAHCHQIPSFWKHFITKASPDGFNLLEYCSTNDQISDIFNKPVWDDIFFNLRKNLLGW